MTRNNKLLAIFLSMIILASFATAQDEVTSFRTAAQRENPTERAQALEQFIAQYPNGTFKNRAYYALFTAYVELKNEPEALKAAADYLNTLTLGNYMDAYNDLAYTLAEGKIGLDSANAYAERAENSARATQSRHLGMILDTRAFVLYQKGDFQTAEKLQREAIIGNENDVTYLFHLALYEAGTGKRIEALNTIAWSLLQGDGQQSLDKFNEWLALEQPDSAQRSELRKSIVMTAVNRLIDSAHTDMKLAAQSNAAVFMARMDVDLPTAERWTSQASSSLEKNSSIADYIGFNKNLAIVLSLEGKNGEALKIFSSIEQLVDPWESDFWLLAGQTFEKANQPKKAIEAYESGLVAFQEPKLMAAYTELYKKENGSTDGIDKRFEELKKSNSEFSPGRFKGAGTSEGRVVLAELFTGAECGPCQGADVGFDKLAEYFPRTTLAILEYHVHIPGPDPMTTPDTWERYRFYNERSGTPTAYFDGGDVVGGGGPRYVAKNRFNVYKFDVEKQLNDTPEIKLSMEVKSRGDDISVGLTIQATTEVSKFRKPVFHIALVEKAVEYTGANGISTHRFVVRDLVDGPLGTPLSLQSELTKESKTINLKKVEGNISHYLDNIRNEPSFPMSMRNFSGWKARPDTLNRKNLAVVAFVQDMDSKEILQAVYKDIPYRKK